MAEAGAGASAATDAGRRPQATVVDLYVHFSAVFRPYVLWTYHRSTFELAPHFSELSAPKLRNVISQ